MINCPNCNKANDHVNYCSYCSFPLNEEAEEHKSNNRVLAKFTLIDQKKNRYSLKLGTSSIGRSKKADIVINDTYMSRFHAEVIVKKNACFIKDLGSSNGTLVENKKISSDPVEMLPGYQITCGSTKLTILST